MHFFITEILFIWSWCHGNKSSYFKTGISNLDFSECVNTISHIKSLMHNQQPVKSFFCYKHFETMINKKVRNCNVKSALSGLFLYGDAVFYAAWQQEQVLQLQSFILTQDVVLDLLQLCSEPIDQLQGPLLREVLLRVLAQRNLGRRKINNLSLRGLSPYHSQICFQTDQRWTHSIWLGSSQMPCDRHLHTGLADVWERGHDHLHGNSILVCWWWLPHGAGGVGDPGTPVKLKIKES